VDIIFVAAMWYETSVSLEGQYDSYRILIASFVRIACQSCEMLLVILSFGCERVAEGSQVEQLLVPDEHRRISRRPDKRASTKGTNVQEGIISAASFSVDDEDSNISDSTHEGRAPDVDYVQSP